MSKKDLALTTEWDKTFPKSELVYHEKVTFANRYGITLAADQYTPQSASWANCAAVAVCGPFGAVKEQCSGLYAQTLAERGFLTIAFDPSFTGESGGEPRYTASPDINTEDFQAAVDFLSVQDNVDPERIGILGICGWGGLALNAAAIDTRVKATVALHHVRHEPHQRQGLLRRGGQPEAARHQAPGPSPRQREPRSTVAAHYARAGGVADPACAGGRSLLCEGLLATTTRRPGLPPPLSQLQRGLEHHRHHVLPEPAHPRLRR